MTGIFGMAGTVGAAPKSLREFANTDASSRSILPRLLDASSDPSSGGVTARRMRSDFFGMFALTDLSEVSIKTRSSTSEISAR